MAEEAQDAPFSFSEARPERRQGHHNMSVHPGGSLAVDLFDPKPAATR